MPDQTGNQVFTPADDGARAAVASGETFEVRLPAQPGTGYGWTVEELDGEVIALVDDRLIAAGEKELGAKEAHVFHFKARARGETRLRFDYRRPWEAEEPAAQSFTLILTIE
jgi:inhibitor of cysteine peptidase